MNRQQKMAWLFVITISVAVILSAGAVGLLYAKLGFPRAAAGLGFLGIAGLGGLGPLIFKKGKEPVSFDERDSVIQRSSALAGFAAAWLVLGLACMIPFFVLGPKATVPVTVLPMIFMGAGLSNYFFSSLTLLIAYGRGGKENE